MKPLNYWPLGALTMVSALAALAIYWHTGGGHVEWMHYFMGIFLCCFAMLKIFDVPGFAKGFRMYDIIAKRTPLYAYIYPFIELALGLGYLSFFMPQIVYLATIIVMLLSAISVVISLKKGLNVNCACMGSVLQVPLSTVTLTEDILMGLMAAALLL